MYKRLGFVVACGGSRDMHGCFSIFVVSLGLAILGHTGYAALLHDIVRQSNTALSSNLLMVNHSTYRKPEGRFTHAMLTTVVTSTVNNTEKYYLLGCDAV
jgi:hypothetical protein